MLVLKKGVTGIDITEINELYKLNNPDENAPLPKAFDWNKSPQGYQFWSFVNSMTTTVKAPVDKVREQLRLMPDKLQYLVIRELDKVPNRMPHKILRFAFKWNDTPQGRAYWELVSDLIQYYSEQSGAPFEYNPTVTNGQGQVAAN